MTKSAIDHLTYCVGTALGEIYDVHYASGKVKTYYSIEALPKSVWVWATTQAHKVSETPKGKGRVEIWK